MSWYAVKPEVTSNGTPGGDLEVTDAWNVRLWNDDLPNAVLDVDVYVEYVADAEMQPTGEYVVSAMLQYTICDDRERPGDTEHWADIEYDNDADPLGYTDIEPADSSAKRIAEDYARNADKYIIWDGEPFSR